MPPEQPNIVTPEDVDPNLRAPIEHKPQRRWWWFFVVFDLLVITPALLGGALWYILNQPPSGFVPQTIEIEPGTSVRAISAQLADASIVKSEDLLNLTLRITQDATLIKAGMYEFTQPQTTYQIAAHLVSGDILNELVTLTFIEGESAASVSNRAAAVLEEFDADEFALLTVNHEGRLFPDTYFVAPDFTTTELVQLLTEKHVEVLNELLTTGSTSLSQEEIVTIASIVEREANTPESMRTVAGIFLNRLTIGMPLQADASIEYALETSLNELPPGQLATELREFNSPYNTYLNPGLPPTPIGNPGRIALSAVINPIESAYFYYITGDDGEFYYAETYDQHLNNIARYLR